MNNDKRRLIDNFISLSLLQGANYILPLITLPYLVRVVGPERFGLIAFSQSFIQYFVILVDYGFSLSAVREISIYRNDKAKISKIFSSVITIKFGLMITAFIMMSIIVFSFEKFKLDWMIYYFAFGIVVGQFLFPSWFFQGIERMRYISVLNFLASIIYVITLFIFIREESDYLYVPLLNSLGLTVAGLLGMLVIFKSFSIRFKKPSFEDLRHQLKEGWHIFISTVTISLYTVTNTFILGIFTNNTIVGYYSAAERLIRAVQGLLFPISQTIFPYISKLVGESKEKAILFIKRITLMIGFFSLAISIFIFVFSGFIVKLLLGDQFFESIQVLKILSFLPFIIALSNIFGVQTMVTFGYKKAFSNILIVASVINLFLALILVIPYQHIGISIAVLLTEIYVTTAMYLFLNKKRIKII